MIGDDKLFCELGVGDIFFLYGNYDWVIQKVGPIDLIYLKTDGAWSYKVSNPGFYKMMVITLCD